MIAFKTTKKDNTYIEPLLSAHVFCGVRLGGMGIAIGSAVGKQLADLLD